MICDDCARYPHGFEGDKQEGVYRLTITAPLAAVEANSPGTHCGNHVAIHAEAFIGWGWSFTVTHLDDVELVA